MIFPLCHSNEINDPGSKSFEIKYGRKEISLFVVHKDGSFNAYINSCGSCVAGPCVGDHLQAVKLVIENGQISAQFDPP